MASIETLGALERRISASISQQQIRNEVETRLKRLSRTARLHGFRPGKVPLKVLEKQYGAQLHQEALGDALQRAFVAAVEENSLKVAGNPDFEIKTDDPMAGEIEYSATFEVYPEVVLGDISAENVVRVNYELSETDVDNTIETLRKQRAVFEVCKHAAQNEDQVHLDFSGTLNGESFDGGDAKNFKVVLGVGRMLPDFENAIIGMKASETKSFDMTFPEDYHGKNVAGKQVKFTVTVHAVEEPRLPEINAAFAKSMGIKDGDVARFRSEIRSNLAREIERRLKLRNKDSVMEALLRIATLEVPKKLLDFEARNIMQQTLRDMKERGMQMPQGMTLPPDLFNERALKRVKLGLILGEMVKQHKLDADSEQIKAMVQDYAQSFDRSQEVVEWHYSDPSRLQAVENLVLEDNVVAWVMGAASVTDKTIEFNELMGKD